MAEELGKGLQNPVHECESRPRLQLRLALQPPQFTRRKLSTASGNPYASPQQSKLCRGPLNYFCMNEKQLAGCVITDSQKRVLLLHRNTLKLRQWEIPGGQLEVGETHRAAAKREVLEELGVQVITKQLLGFTEFDGPEGEINKYLWYAAEIIVGDPAPQETKHDAIGYFDLSQPHEGDRLSISAHNLARCVLKQEILL